MTSNSCRTRCPPSAWETREGLQPKDAQGARIYPPGSSGKTARAPQRVRRPGSCGTEIIRHQVLWQQEGLGNKQAHGHLHLYLEHAVRAPASVNARAFMHSMNAPRPLRGRTSGRDGTASGGVPVAPPGGSAPSPPRHRRPQESNLLGRLTSRSLGDLHIRGRADFISIRQ